MARAIYCGSIFSLYGVSQWMSLTPCAMVQRLPRYKMLLQQLLSHTEEGHHDFPGLTSALDLIRYTANYSLRSIYRTVLMCVKCVPSVLFIERSLIVLCVFAAARRRRSTRWRGWRTSSGR